jgi:hypothetical protein
MDNIDSNDTRVMDIRDPDTRIHPDIRDPDIRIHPDIRDTNIRIHPDIRDTDISVMDGDVDMNANYDNDDEKKDSDYDRYNINKNKRSGNPLAVAGGKRLPMSFHMICNGYRKHGKILEMVKFIEKYGLVEK